VENKINTQIVETKYYQCCEPPHELLLESGEKLGPITLAYETYGTLNEEKTNAILITHALSGDAHAAGYHPGDKHPGWWDKMIGPNKSFDTNKYFIICSNVIGSCKGSTGPASMDPKTNKPYGLNFPIVTIKDMVNAQKLLIDHLSIKKLLAVAGGSMGGMQTLQWAVTYPDFIASAVVISTNAKHTAQQIAFHEVSRQAILADPNWLKGDYYGKITPSRGLALARMIGHITYMSNKSMSKKFGRKRIGEERLGFDFSQAFEVEGYLKYRGNSFVQRFDANSWMYISKALDYFDIAEDSGSLTQAFSSVQAKFLVISFTSDWLYPPEQTKEIVRALRSNDLDVSDIEINASYGHDSFLIEVEDQSNIISHFLKRIDKNIKNGS